ncbi:hypothetical protein [Dongshaea marina]|uniref:hypothetical protein n=1 Tax=Dongshaea marina TaxID=2047966 RepID=UPI000D3E3C50|nr:hypothetical protein [Dongshaea marina]
MADYENGSETLSSSNGGFGWGDANISITAQNKWSIYNGINQNLTAGFKSMSVFGLNHSLNLGGVLSMGTNIKLTMHAGYKYTMDKYSFDLKVKDERAIAEEFETKLQSSVLISELTEFTAERSQIALSEINSITSQVNAVNLNVETNFQKIEDDVNSIRTVVSDIEEVTSSIEKKDMLVQENISEIKNTVSKIEEVTSKITTVDMDLKDAQVILIA